MKPPVYTPHPKPFKPQRSSDAQGLAKQCIGISIAPNTAASFSLLPAIAENTPIRLLAETEFQFLSKPDETCQSLLAHLVRYRNLSAEALNADRCAAVISRMDCLITNCCTHAQVALLLNIPVWFFHYSNHDGAVDALKLKNRWGGRLSLIILTEGQPVGEIFLAYFLYRLLNGIKHAFTPFGGDYQIQTSEGTVPFNCPQIQTPDQLVPLLKRPLFPFASVTIETTSICNLTCTYCPNSKFERDKTFMRESMFFRIIDSIAGYDPHFSGEIRPHLYGEPLIDERLEDFVRYAKHRLPDARIAIFTNGHFLTPARFLSLKRAGVDMLHISQHQPEPLPALEKALAEIKENHPELYTVTYNIEYLAEYKMNRGGLLDVTSQPLPDSYYSRCASYRDLTFDVHGNAVLCCNDYFSKHVFGNIDETPIRDIWDSASYSIIRDKLFFGLLPLTICKNCMHIERYDAINQSGRPS